MVFGPSTQETFVSTPEETHLDLKSTQIVAQVGAKAEAIVGANQRKKRGASKGRNLFKAVNLGKRNPRSFPQTQCMTARSSSTV